MPQLATSLGFDYFHPKMWFFNTNINYYDKNYVSIMPTRRTAAALNFATAGMTQEEVNAKAKAIVDQEKFAASFVWDASVGKLIYFKNKTSLSINLTVQNILNKKDIRTGGFEQGRFDTESFNVGKFPSKYFYMQGINYFLNIGYRF
jgi:outer membrane receptor protein involved in Fe transport